MRIITALALLLMWMTLGMGAASLGMAGESRWTRLKQYWGEIKALKIDKCGHRPGLCEGTIVLTQRGNGDIVLAIRPGTWIKRGERLMLIEQLQIGEEIHVQAFEIEGERGLQATNIDLTKPR